MRSMQESINNITSMCLNNTIISVLLLAIKSITQILMHRSFYCTVQQKSYEAPHNCH